MWRIPEGASAFAPSIARAHNRVVLLVIAIVLAIFVVPDAWDVPVIAVGATLEVAELGFEVWLSRRRRPTVGPETLIGQTGEVIALCRPLGQVRVAGEPWLARCDVGADVGESVTVRGREGLTLVVEPVPHREYPDPAPGR